MQGVGFGPPGSVDGRETDPYRYADVGKIMTTRAPVQKAVPDGAKREFAKAFNKAISDVVKFNDVLAWSEFFMLPQSVLAGTQSQVDRGGAGVGLPGLEPLSMNDVSSGTRGGELSYGLKEPARANWMRCWMRRTRILRKLRLW